MNNLEVVNNEEFSQSIFDGIFEGIKITYIGHSAFNNSSFSGSLNLPVCTAIGGHAFRNSNFSGSLDLPVCTYVGQDAFFNSNFNSITIGANAELYTNCIGAHSAEFIADYAANGKQAGTYVWDSVSGHWIYQT